MGHTIRRGDEPGLPPFIPPFLLSLPLPLCLPSLPFPCPSNIKPGATHKTHHSGFVGLDCHHPGRPCTLPLLSPRSYDHLEFWTNPDVRSSLEFRFDRAEPLHVGRGMSNLPCTARHHSTPTGSLAHAQGGGASRDQSTMFRASDGARPGRALCATDSGIARPTVDGR